MRNSLFILKIGDHCVVSNIISKAGYEVLAEFHYTLRRFVSFSENAAEEAGLTTQQHQALLAIMSRRKAMIVGMSIGLTFLNRGGNDTESLGMSLAFLFALITYGVTFYITQEKPA